MAAVAAVVDDPSKRTADVMAAHTADSPPAGVTESVAVKPGDTVAATEKTAVTEAATDAVAPATAAAETPTAPQQAAPTISAAAEVSAQQQQGAPAPSAPALEGKKIGAAAEVKPATDATLGLEIPLDSAFQVSRNATKRAFECLETMRRIADDGEAVDSKAMSDVSRNLWLRLMEARHCHRTLAKVMEMGRSAEASARRTADTEFALLETRRYESACRRSAARRCRIFPTPELNKLKGVLTADSMESDAEDVKEGVEPEQSVLGRELRAESSERTRLQAELQALLKEKAEMVESFRESRVAGDELTTKLHAAAVALEPVCDLLQLRKRRESVPLLDTGLESLPTPLRLVHSKFDVLAAFGSAGGVEVAVEDSADSKIGGGGDAEGEPAEKRARRESSVVRVVIAKAPNVKDSVTLRFSMHSVAAAKGDNESSEAPSLVAVACQGNDTLLDHLWPEDDGRTGPLASAAGVLATGAGRVYGWAQSLAGLRSVAAPLLPSGSENALSTGAGVTASDIVLNLRKRLSAEN